ncbi:MAG: hypothetical protein IID39_07465 [Planctomycetes bacterium]|nr:hypothetical protein [Planctomycetota bacterium]
MPLRHSVGRFKRLTPLAVGLILTLHLAAATTAEEVIVQNDSVGDFDDVVIVGDFIPQEEAAAWLTSPCDGAIVAVQVLWLSIDPGAPPSLEENLWIRESGSFPTPGPTLLQLEGPVMVPGFLNEFRYLDEAKQFPINVPVSSAETFVVSLEFANPTDIVNGTPSVVRDIDGCQPGRNALFAIPGNWLNFCIFLQGDLVIRAVVDCADATGACCLDSGDCIDGVSAAQCAAQGGDYQGDGTDCESVNCVQACCLPTGQCADVTVEFCIAGSGVPQGAGSDCGSTDCPLTGACCLDSGDCIDAVTSDECIAQGGAYQGDNTDCESTTCRQACCLPEGCADVTVDFCTQSDGEPQGAGTECDSTNCFPIGACCLPDGSCAPDVLENDCQAQGGIFQGDGVLCSEVQCPEPVGACCVGENCKVMTERICDIFNNSEWAGPGTDCGDRNQNDIPDACEPCGDPSQDADRDCDVDLTDYQAFGACATGPFTPYTDPDCACFDGDGDGDIDLIDWGFFQIAFTGEGPGCP